MAATVWGLAMLARAQQAGIVKEIIIRGNQRVSKEAILAAMRTKVGQPYTQETLDRDKRSLDDLGFFEAVDLRPAALEGNDWSVTVSLVEYPEVKEIRVVGNTAVSTKEILDVVKPFMKAGDVFNRNSLRPAAEAIKNLYGKKGFVEQVIDFAPLKDSPNTVNLAIEETRVGKISVQGAKTTRDWVFRRLIKTKSGEPFSTTKWVNDLRRMQNTQWFESVKWVDDPNQEDLSKINLIADVVETKTGQFNVGVQLDPSNSFAGILRLSDINFQGTGQTVSVNFIQSIQGNGPSVDLDYVNPFLDSLDTTLRFSVYSRLVFRFSNIFSSNAPTSSSDQYNERHTGVSLGFSRPVTPNTSLGISGRFENVKTNNVTTTIADQFVQQDGDVAVATLGFVRNRRDRDQDATRGDWLRVDVEPGYANINEVGGAVEAKEVLGSHTFVKNTLEYRQYFTDQGLIGKDFEATRRVLALRFRAGTIDGIVPYFEQYFAGGTDTIRGYDEGRFWDETSSWALQS